MSAAAALPLGWSGAPAWADPIRTTVRLRPAAGRATIARGIAAPTQPIGTPLQDEDGADQKGAADIPRMAAIAAGDERAFAAIVEETSGRLLRFARSMLGSADEAEDAVQETFLRLHERAAEWRPEARIGTWLHRVCYNNCIDRLRRRRPQADPALLAGIEDERPLAEAGMVAAEAAAGVRAAIAALPERQRSALLLFHFQDLTQREAAEIMAVSEDAFESLLSRARRQLRRALTEPQLPAKGDDHD
jgi:RNA polymerase sigma-70 factor (ECF subfamily)